MSAPPAVLAADQRSRLHTVPIHEWLWLAAAAILGLALRMPFFGIAMVADEGGYAYATRGWVEGTGRLYDDLWISRPQGIFFVYAGIFDLLGTDTVAIRFATWIAAVVTTLIVWGIARSWLGPRVAILSAIIFTVLSASPNLEGYTANAEIFMGAPAALSALWLFHTGRSGWHRLNLFGIGIAIAIATSLKPSAIVMFAVAVTYIVLLTDVPARVTLRRVGWMVAGGAIVLAISLLHGWYLGWHNYIYATLTYRLTAQSSVTVGFLYNVQALGRLILRLWALITLIGLCLVLGHYAGVMRDLDLLSHPRRWSRSRWRIPHLPDLPRPRSLIARARRPRPDEDGDLLLHLWLLGAVAGMSIGGDWWPHYVIQLTPPLAIWLGRAISSIHTDLTSWGRRLFAPLAVVLLLVPFSVLRFGSTEAMQEAMFSHPGYPAQDEVAAYIREHTAPGTSIYVAFDQASIYYVADRPPAYRHLYDQELRGIPSSYAEIISIITGPNPPLYIIGTRQPGPFPDDSSAFWAEVGQYYKLEIMIEGVPIYRLIE